MSKAVLLLVGLALALPSPDTARGALAHAYDGGDLQREWPGGGPDEVPANEAPVPPPEPARGDAVEDVIRALVWVAIAVGAIVLLVWATERYRVGRPERAVGPAPTPVSTPDAVRVAKDDAEALAADGRFAEAIHALLLRTLAALPRDRRIPTAWTSREIAATVELDPEARAALERLVDATEASLFGGRPADAAGFAACVESWRRLRAATAGGPA